MIDGAYNIGANPAATPDISAADMLNNNGLTSPNINQGKDIDSLKVLFTLGAGEVFRAVIEDIQPNSIELKMKDGSILNARSLTVPDARIGDMANFVVRENNGKGQISLEFLHPQQSTGGVPISIVKEALSAANMQHTPQNALIIESLVQHNLSIDISAVQRAAFFMYSMPEEQPFENIAFLLKNNFAPTNRTVEMFLGLQSGNISLQTEYLTLKTILQNIESSQLKGFFQNIINKTINLDYNNLQNILEYMQNIKDIKNQMDSFNLQGLSQNDKNILNLASETFSTISDIIDFSQNIDANKEYMQFLFGDAAQNLAKLHVLKNKKNNKEKDGSKNATALLALDMAHIGHIEVYIVKNGKDVSLQFRAQRGKTVGMINVYGHKIAELLEDKGYTLTAISTKIASQKFDIIQNIDNKETKNIDSHLNINNIDGKNEQKRYSFDVRV